MTHLVLICFYLWCAHLRYHLVPRNPPKNAVENVEMLAMAHPEVARRGISWECGGKMLGICWEYLGIVYYHLVI